MSYNCRWSVVNTVLEAKFELLGFTQNEINVYLRLAEMGKATASAVARRAEVPRTTTYSVLDSLIARGVVSIEQDRGASYYVPNQPSALIRAIESERLELDEREQAAKDLVELVQPFFRSEHFSVTAIKFFEGKENVEQMLYEFTPLWQQSIYAVDSTWWGYQDHTFVEQYLAYLHWTWLRMKKDEKINLFSNEADIEHALKGTVENREIRPVPAKFPFSSSIWVLGEYIVLIMTKQQPHYAFQLKDAVFAANLRLIFQLLWSKI